MLSYRETDSLQWWRWNPGVTMSATPILTIYVLANTSSVDTQAIRVFICTVNDVELGMILNKKFSSGTI